MRKSIRAFAIVSSVVAGFSVAPALYTHASEASGDTLMGSGMMEGCSRMMQSMSHDGFERPNERWHKTSPDNNGLPGTNE
ncbi:hypothetical protein [Roseibium aggregatum]|jgi:hypothetical protein|uniref:hypothetical protein n=1 Tax=Roseibium aggregatum TaxID=187304 RepID=UPI001E4AD434|nr:hypothetical protein [Roseibium aggregatum]UES47990.1 hypothetical protein GFK90_29020 [Roseibium aggregatum]